MEIRPIIDMIIRKLSRTKCFQGCEDGSGEPIVQPLRNLSELLDWFPGGDEACLSKTPLAVRTSPPTPDTPRTLICHDLQGGYLQDRFPQGVCTMGSYRFTHWQYVDTFVYFSHYFITIPPPAWVTAAHKHGVKVLGTVITEWEEGYERMKALLQTHDTMIRVVDQLAAIATYYNFDGWLINIENKIEPDMIPVLMKFMICLTKKTHKSHPQGEVIWYDSVTCKGELLWQNALNDLNSQFYEVCDGIFLNYTWTEQDLVSSREYSTAQGRHGDIYVGVDVFGRGCRGGGGYNTCEAVSVARNCGLSVAIFAPAWVYERQPKEDFIANEKRFWNCLKELCTPHGLGELPLVTHFCHGLGHGYYLKGKRICAQPWLNQSLQSLQPMLREPQIMGDNSSELVQPVASLCTRESFCGGSCLQLEGSFSGSCNLLRFRLFETDVLLREPLMVSYTWKTEDVGQFEIFMELEISTASKTTMVPLVTSQSQIPANCRKLESDISMLEALGEAALITLLPLGSMHCNTGLWETRYFHLEKLDDGARLKALSVVMQVRNCDSGRINILLGELQILPMNLCKAPLLAVENLEFHPNKNGAVSMETLSVGWLSWKHEHPESIDYYNIYITNKLPVVPPEDRWMFLGHSIACVFKICDFMLEKHKLPPGGTVTFLVQPVYRTGFVPVLSLCSVTQNQ